MLKADVFKTKTIDSPVGRLSLIASGRGLVAVLWENDWPGRVRLPPLTPDEHDAILTQAERQLSEYFAGQRTTFDLPLDPRGTPFQRAVWAELLKIPFGQTTSYATIAASLGKPKAVRAVGAANGKNPLSIVTPCHRVIGRDGSLTGFAGGLAVKAWLLELEKPSAR